jgi:hypothetical protein
MLRTHSFVTDVYNLSNWQRRQITHLEEIIGLVRRFQGRVGVGHTEERIWKVCFVF